MDHSWMEDARDQSPGGTQRS